MTSNSHDAMHAETFAQTMLQEPPVVADGVRALSRDEIEGVSGGVLDPLSILLGGAAVAVGYAVGSWLFSSKSVEPAPPTSVAAK